MLFIQRRAAPPGGLGKRRGVGDVTGQGAVTCRRPAVHELSIGVVAVSVRPHSLLPTAATRLARDAADSTAVQRQPRAACRPECEVVDRLQVISRNGYHLRRRLPR